MTQEICQQAVSSNDGQNSASSRPVIGTHSPREQLREDISWQVIFSDVTDQNQLEIIWTDLQSRADASFFQSWGWMHSWLRALPRGVRPRLLQVLCYGRPVGLAVLVQRRIRRHLIFLSRALLVSETGRLELDKLTIEHNGFLMEKGLEAEVVKRSLEFLTNSESRWDELFISGIDKSHAVWYRQAANEINAKLITQIQKSFFYVDVLELKKAGSDYMSSLSANTRYQLRRAIREYEKHGALICSVASTLDQALEYFQQLRQIHQQHWTGKGERGAFASEFANSFHDILIRSRFSTGEIQLIKISAGPKPLGYLYNFVLNGIVSNYQSGFYYENDPKLKPGSVSHYLAVIHNMQHDVTRYDFLMGEHRYKRSLATHEAEMVWLVLQRRRLRFALEHFMRALRSRFAS